MLSAAADVGAIGFLEYPEDLGATARGVPASLWQLPAAKALSHKGYHRGALYQDEWADVDYLKPTGLLTSAQRIRDEPDFVHGLAAHVHGSQVPGPFCQVSLRHTQV